MKNLVFRLFFITIASVLLFIYIFPWSSYGIEVPFTGLKYKLGLDLQGGIELDFKVDLTEARQEKDYNNTREKEIIEGLKSIIEKRIVTLNINDSNIVTSNYAGEKHIIVKIPLKGNSTFEDTENTKRIKDAIGKVVTIEFKELNSEYSTGTGNISEKWIRALDSEGRYLSDKYFVKSSVQFNEAFNPMVELTFNSDGAKIFGELTSRLVGRQLAIFVGGELLTSPNINEPIYGGKAVITGNYTPEEAKNLANNINTGVVPAPIYLTSEKTIDSTLGVSSLEKLIKSGIIGFLIIFVFLLFIYRASGFMASLSLFIYICLILAIIKSFGITLTLASIAGLILSIGMAIDANILIFERIKDELKTGKNFLDASSIGFKKSWSAIWDSNVTGFLVAMILYIFGINLIKGFGLMLAIGIVVSLFTVMWISRILILILANIMKNKNTFIGK